MLKPFGIGAIMAAMMLWMLHDPIMSGMLSLKQGGLGFVLAHVAVVAGFAALGLFIPKLRSALASHRPNLRHTAAMLLGMLVMGGGAHLVLHGVV